MGCSSDAERVRFLLPHFRRALQMQQRIALLDAEARTVSGVLDRLPLGIVLIGHGKQILLMNRAAREMVDLGDGLGVGASGLHGGTPAESAALSRLIAASAATGNGAAAEAGGLVRLSRPSMRRSFEVLVSPFRGTALADGQTARPAALVVLADPERDGISPADALHRAYGLSAQESEVVWRLAQGERQVEIAAALEVSPETVRTYIRRAMIKTDTRRPVELVRVVTAGLADILAPKEM